MDEVENPALPAAGETSPTLRPIEDGDDNDENENENDSAIVIGSPIKSPLDEAIINTESILLSSDSSTPLETAARSPTSPNRFQQLPPTRPKLQREGSGSAVPPLQPPPAPPVESNDFAQQDPPDSLTLADLKRLRGEFPNNKANGVPQKEIFGDFDGVYDFRYADCQSLPVEVEEWFCYSAEELGRLKACREVFDHAWGRGVSDEGGEVGEGDGEGKGQGWLDVTEDVRRAFVSRRVKKIANGGDEEEVRNSLMVLTYIGLGIWEETATRQDGSRLEDLFPECSPSGGTRLSDFKESSTQIRWIAAMIDTLHGCDGLRVIYDCLRKTCDEDFKNVSLDPHSFRNESLPRRPEESIELWCCLTLMYLFIEVARALGGEGGQVLKKEIRALEPNLLNYFTQTVARLRWDESAPVPLTKMLLLAWKAILVTIGGISDVEKVKASLHEDHSEMDSRGQPIITASPLDYHLFRQEISSKYPAYQPPAPLFPLEPDNNTILPPLKHRRPSYTFTDAAYTGAPSVGTDSIVHQPVHIATPAPSPPPSPAGPGKAGKKQNYQTNQMFPFLYPPLDTSSNELGGKGATQLQDALVGRKWEGSDVPTSILEAADLFAKRMRATRAMKQLWEARVDFMKYERGWKGAYDGGDKEGVDVDEDGDGEDFEVVEKPTKPEEESAEQGQPLEETDEQRMLNAVGHFYRDSLSHLQSVVIVLLKAVLQNVTDLVTRGNGVNGLQAGIHFNDPQNGMNGASTTAVTNGTAAHEDGIENTAEELDKLRTQEIASKALSAILILLLKWFKVSHVLQYEYLTQLLLDSNFVPLVLKLWQTQDLGRACHVRLEREECNFFFFCREDSRQGLRGVEEQRGREGSADHADAAGRDSDDDEALPPPIKLKRQSVPENPLSPTSPAPDFNHPPEVDELGYPQTPIPASPITSYSYRNVFSSINYLRCLQKVTRRKTHRALLLVSYKSSNHLKKSLKIPITLLRYYTLKLFKSQVPFCGRKWRQGNMKIITAVWLSVPAELRDDWLSGGGGGMGGGYVGDVDGTVEDALPLEQSLRALTHWWNVRNFGGVMGFERGLGEFEEEGGGFFGRELEKMVGEGMVEEEFAGEEMGFQGPIEGY